MREAVTIVFSKAINFISILALYRLYAEHLDAQYILIQIVFSLFVSYYASIAHLSNRVNKFAMIFCIVFTLALLVKKILGEIEIGAALIITLPLIGFLNYANTIYSKIDKIFYYSVARLGLVLVSPHISDYITSALLWIFIFSYLHIFAKASLSKPMIGNKVKIDTGINISIIATIAAINIVEAYIKYVGVKDQTVILFEVIDVYLPMFGVIYTLQYQMLQRHTINDKLTLSERKNRLVYIIMRGLLLSLIFIVSLQALSKLLELKFEVPSPYYLLLAALLALSNAIRSYFVNGAMLMIQGIGNETSLKLLLVLILSFFVLNLYGISPLYSYVISGAFSSLIFGAITWLRLR